MNLVLQSILLGVLPMFAYAAMLWWIDHWEREPVWLVSGAFLWGALPAVFVAALFQMVVGASLFGSIPVGPDVSPEIRFLAVVVAPITEEICKGLLLLLIFTVLRHEIDSTLDGLVYGAIIGFGFAAVENVGYFYMVGRDYRDQLWLVVILRAFAFGPIHAFFTGLTGLGFAAARFERNPVARWIWPLCGLAAAMFFHALHNLWNTQPDTSLLWPLACDWLGIAWLTILGLVSLLSQRLCIAASLREEVTRGVLSPQQAQRAGSPGQSLMHAAFPFLYWLPEAVKERRLATLSAELAFKKRQLARLGGEPGVRESIDLLRYQLHLASRALLPAAAPTTPTTPTPSSEEAAIPKADGYTPRGTE